MVVNMKRTPLYSILLLCMLLLTMVPYISLPELASNPMNSLTPSQHTSPATSPPRSSIDYAGPTPPTVNSNDNREIPNPDIPTSRIGQGNQREARLDWNHTESFSDRDNITDFQVPIERGYLLREVAGFNRIGDISQWKDYVYSEDWLPGNGWYYYWPLWVGEITFSAFNISGHSPTQIEGFSVYSYSAPSARSEGILNYTVFAAMPNSTSGHGTKPDVLVQVVPWMQIAFSVAVNTEQWVLLPALFPIILDSGMTYGDTFYLAISLGSPTSTFNWVLMDDVGTPPFSDNGEDDSDAWWYDPGDSWPNLTFIDGPSIDFFCNVGFYRHPYPSEISMMVNGTPVWDLYPYPGVGFWDGGVFPPKNMTNRIRYFDVDYTWPGTTYDVTWLGWFAEPAVANSSFRAYPDLPTVDWNITLVADFPSSVINKTITIHIEPDWAVLQVLHDGTPHGAWTVFFANGKWWIEITNADNGIWTVICDGPDYVVDIIVEDQFGSVVDWVYAADWVFPTGLVKDPISGNNATDGLGWMFIYDPFTNDHYNRSVMLYPEGAVEFYWPVWHTINALGVYTLHIIWSNGYQAGMNSTTLTVIQSPSMLDVYNEDPEAGKDVVKGQKIIFDLFYGDYMGYGLPTAIITVEHENGTEWYDYTVYNWASESYWGYYSVVLGTNTTVDIQYNLTLYIEQEFYDEQTHTKNFTIYANEAHIVFFLGSGLVNSTDIYNNTIWRTAPEPLINTTNIVFTILYTDDAGIPHAGAIIEAYLVKGPVGNRKIRRLPWEDLSESTQTPGSHGKYNITVDTNPILGDAFHDGEEAFIIIYAHHYDYEMAVSEYIYVRPQPRPTWIDVPSQYRQITLYENWTYPTIEHPVILRVILRDLLSGEDLSHGTITAEVPGVGNTTLTLATGGLGLYEIPILETHNLVPGTYNVTLFSTARDFVDSSTRITLIIRPKQTISYTCTPIFSSAMPNQGQSWQLDFQFYLENSSTYMMTSSSISGANKQAGIEYLEPGTKVTLSITVAGTAESLVEYVGEDGEVSFEGVLAIEGNYRFYISIEGAEKYAELANAPFQMGGSTFSIQVVSLTTLISSNLPTLAILGAIIIFVPLGSVLSFRHYVVMPKRRKRLAKYQAIADTFSDVANLNRLLVLHKESGICVFDPFAEESQDATLVAGFLQAISTFGHDLADSPGLTNGEKTEGTALRELQYEDFRILIHDGQFVRNALVLGGVPSEQLRERLENFTKAFETRYKGDFEHWDGRVDQFNSAADLVEEIFLISLRHPHTVAPSKPRGTQLSSLESDIYSLSKELTKDREYVFLGQILSTYLAAGRSSNLEALMAIYQLRVKGLFEPIQLPPIPPASKSAG